MPIRKDKTNVAPIYREQVFIPASGTTLMKQKARPKFNGFPIASGAIDIVSPEFDLLTGIRGITNLPKGFLKTNKLPQGENLYYRQLDKSSKGLERAKQIGVIDTKSSGGVNFTTSRGTTLRIGKTFDTPFFAKGSLWYNNVDDMDVIVGKDNPLLDWKMITQHGRVTENTLKAANRRTPFYNGTTNQAPTELFELYRRYPGIGYRNVTHGFPTIPITGLNTASEQMKCGGRRKAQLGLDIREGGIAIPIAPNMYYMNGRSHDDGGIAIGPNNKNGLEVEGGEVVKVGKNDVKVFSSVPLLRGASPAELVMGGANPNKVFAAQEKYKDKHRINDDGTRYKAGGIYIKPSKRGTFTAAATKHGMGVQEFASKVLANKDNYSSAMVKKANFARNASRWKKEYGGEGNVLPETVVTPTSNYKKIYDASGINKRKKIAKDILQILPFSGFVSDVIAAITPNGISEPLTTGGAASSASAYGLAKAKVPFYSIPSLAFKSALGLPDLVNDIYTLYNDIKTPKEEFNRNKKEYGGSMIYTINGNVKNGLNLRSKALFGTRKKFAADGEDDERKEKKINADTKIGIDGLIYRRGVDSDWYTDGTKYEDSEYYFGNTSAQQRSREKIKGRIKEENKGQVLDEVTVRAYKPRKPFINNNGYVRTFENGSWDYVENEKGKYINIFDHPEEASKILGYKPKIKLNMNTGTYNVFDENYNKIVEDVENAKSVIDKHTEPIEAKEGKYSETKVIGSLVYEKDANGKWIPTTRKIGNNVTNYVRTGANNIGIITTNPLTGERINADNIVETETPSVKSKTRIGTKSTPREGEPKSSTTPVTRGTATVESPRPAIATNPMEARYASRVQKGTVQEPVKTEKAVTEAVVTPDQARYTRAAGFQGGTSPSSTGGQTGEKPKDNAEERWVGQYKTTTPGDWIGLGANVLGSIGSYFITKSAIDKLPKPIRPALYQAAKLKTNYNINPQLTELREAEQVNRETVRRNTQSSNTSLAREQRLMNKARNERNILYGQKENIETQLINQDRLNRQQVIAQNIAAYNDYLNRVTGTKQAQIQAKVSNVNNLISGLTGGVNSILGSIESRKMTNNTLRAIAAANPNVDARLIGGFDYYIGPVSKKKYNKNQQYVGTING